MTHRRLRHTTVVAAIFALAFAGGCGSEPGERSAASDEASVAIRSFMFEPETVRVNIGATVVWTNEDDIAHTVTSGTPGDGGVPGVTEEAAPSPDGRFDEALDAAGAIATVTFEESGTFSYFCSIHDGMTGLVEVS